jgi:hypothetical protein
LLLIRLFQLARRIQSSICTTSSAYLYLNRLMISFRPCNPSWITSPLTDQQDKWASNWGEEYSASKTYKFLVGHINVHQVYKWLQKCFCQPKLNVFFWLLLKDRLSTRNILRRKNLHLDSYHCVLCQLSVKETGQHLFNY